MKEDTMTSMWKQLVIAVILIMIVGIYSLGCSVIQTSNEFTSIQKTPSPKLFSDLDTLTTWLSTQPPTQPIIFYTPVNTTGYRVIDFLRENKNDVEDLIILEFAKTLGSQDAAKLSCERALALQQAALKDGYLISVEYINIGDQVNVGLNHATLLNGDKYSISTDAGSSSTIFIENHVEGSK